MSSIDYKRMQQRGKPEAELLAENPVPVEREFFVAADTGKTWPGDGVTPLSGLPYLLPMSSDSQFPEAVREVIAANLGDPATPEGAAVVDARSGIPYDPQSGFYLPATGRPIASVDDSNLFPPAVMEALRSAIASTLVVDNTTSDAEVASWLAGLTYGTTGRLVGAMTTMTGLQIPNGITLDGSAAKVSAGPGATNHIVRLGSGSVLLGLTVDSSASAPGQNAVEISGVSGAEVRGVRVLASAHHGIEVANSTSVNILNSTVVHCSGIGIALAFVDGVLVSGNTVSDALHGIQFWGGDSASASAISTRNVRVSVNDVRRVIGGIWGSLSSGVVVSGNHLEDLSDVGVDFEGCQDCTATGNTVRNAAVAGLATFYGSTRCTFTGNTVINDTANGAGFKAATSKTSTLISVVGNTFRTAKASAITSDDSGWSDSEIGHNNIDVTAAGQASIVARKSDRMRVIGNLVRAVSTGCVNVGGRSWHVEGNTFQATVAITDGSAGYRNLWIDSTWNGQYAMIAGNRAPGFPVGILDDCPGDNASHSWIRGNQVDKIRYRGTYGNGYYGIIENNRSITDPYNQTVLEPV